MNRYQATRSAITLRACESASETQSKGMLAPKGCRRATNNRCASLLFLPAFPGKLTSTSSVRRFNAWWELTMIQHLGSPTVPKVSRRMRSLLMLMRMSEKSYVGSYLGRRRLRDASQKTQHRHGAASTGCRCGGDRIGPRSQLGFRQGVRVCLTRL